MQDIPQVTESSPVLATRSWTKTITFLDVGNVKRHPAPVSIGRRKERGWVEQTVSAVSENRRGVSQTKFFLAIFQPEPPPLATGQFGIQRVPQLAERRKGDHLGVEVQTVMELFSRVTEGPGGHRDH